jgi:hypothetical protein
MKEKSEQTTEHPMPTDGGFYRRWSEKKRASRQPLVESSENLEEEYQPGDEDMPPLESLDENADYSGFLSPKVSEPLRQLALRKLFHSAAFNVCDGLDDYDEDFTCFEKLGHVMTADLRHRLELEAKKQKEKQQHEPQGESHGIDPDDEGREVAQVDAGPGAVQRAQHADSTDEAER